jgi:threonine dehydrogenase-like Zn-dependent dehydrogenase
VAHHSQLFAVPDTVPERAACLCEPVSVAIHGLLRQPPFDGEPVLVIGAGTIGLAAVAALRALWPSCPVTVVARHDHQAAAALACGAQHVVRSSPDAEHYAALAELSSARVTGSRDEAMLAGGLPFVVEAVGAADSVTEALRVVDNRGIVLLLGVAGISTVDLTPVWWKEAGLVGAVNHAWDPGPREGPTDHSMVRALELLAGGLPPHEVIITHEFPLESYRDALEIAIERRSGSIKVVLRPEW